MCGQPRRRVLVIYPSHWYTSALAGNDAVKSAPLVLASYLARRHEVEYADFETLMGHPGTEAQMRRFERKVRRFLSERNPDVVAISCWTSLNYRATLVTARLAREVHPECLIVVGGYHPSARPGDFVTPGREIDYVVRGEGELALMRIADDMPGQGRPPETTVVDGVGLQPADFAELKWELVDDLLRTEYPDGIGTLCVFLSRGCPFRCTFCVEALKDGCWRPWPAEAAVRQIVGVIERYRVKAVAIGDACFGVQRSWRRQVLQRLAEYAPDCWLLLETRPEFLEREDARLLAGLRVEVQLGIESCSPRMLSVMNKTAAPKRFLEQFRDLSHVLSDLGVVHGANLIFNHPGESRESVRETFDFMDDELKRYNSTLMWACHSYLHFPGSAVDVNRAHYESVYGTVFEKPAWWKETADPFAQGRMVIPSRDIGLEYVDLWRQMLAERQERLKACLAPHAFQLAAQTYFPEWQLDDRFQKTQ